MGTAAYTRWGNAGVHGMGVQGAGIDEAWERSHTAMGNLSDGNGRSRPCPFSAHPNTEP